MRYTHFFGTTLPIRDLGNIFKTTTKSMGGLAATFGCAGLVVAASCLVAPVHAAASGPPPLEPRPPVVQTLAAGGSGTCALMTTGAVRCWDHHGGGNRPVIIPLGGRALTISKSAGAGGACAVLASGAVRCWGQGDFGALGSGSTLNLLDDPGEHASIVPLGGRAISVTSGESHACALLASGVVRCWGFGNRGQLGSGSKQDLMDQPGERPSTVPLGGKAIAVSAGYFHTCALLELGQVRCWGYGIDGQLGSGSTANLMDQPGEQASTVKLGAPAVALSAGYFHTCALLTSGVVRCWGAGDSGALGSGSPDFLMDHPDEQASVVPLRQKAVAISAGGDHTCAILQDGALQCWGAGAAGQLGNGSTANLMASPHERPATVRLGAKAAAVSTGEEQTCVLIVSGTVRCFGAGTLGGRRPTIVLRGVRVSPRPVAQSDWESPPGWSRPTRIKSSCRSPLVLDSFSEPNGRITLVVESSHHASLCLLSQQDGGAWSTATIRVTAEPGEASHLVTRNGLVLLTWRESGYAGRLMASVRDASGVWGPAAAISGTPVYTPVLAERADGELIASWVGEAGADLVAMVATWRHGAGWSTPVSLGPVTRATPGIVVAPDGRATLVWAAPAPDGTSTVKVSESMPGSAWSAPATISQSAGEVVVDSVIRLPDGTLIVAAAAQPEFQPGQPLILEQRPGEAWIAPSTPAAHGSGGLTVDRRGRVTQLLTDSVGPTHWLSSRTRSVSGQWSAPRGLLQDQMLGIGYDSVSFPDGARTILVHQEPVGYCFSNASGQVVCADVGPCPGLLDPFPSGCRTTTSRQLADGSWTKPQPIAEPAFFKGVAVSRSGVAVAGFCMWESAIADLHRDACQLSIGNARGWRKPVPFARDAQIEAIAARPHDRFVIVFTADAAGARYLAATSSSALLAG